MDEFLDDEGTREEFQATAIKEVLAWQIEQAMKKQGLSRRRMAERMGTSRSQIGRLLDPRDGQRDDRNVATRRKYAWPQGSP